MESTEKKLQDYGAVRGCRAFSSVFHKMTARTTEGNVVHSPNGVHLVLSYLCHGADGFSAKEIVAGLCLSDTKKLHLEYREIISRLASLRQTEFRWDRGIQIRENVTKIVTIANAIFVNDGITPKKAFQTKGTDCYGVDLKSVKFNEQEESVDETR